MSDAPERIWADWSPADEDTMPATIGCYTPKTREVARWKRVDYVRADRIEALTAERDYTEGTNDTLIAINQALTAERDSYRKALEDIVADCEAGYPPSHGAIKYAAKLALKGESQ